MYGKRSNRTPLAYGTYRDYTGERLIYASSPEESDLLLTGHCGDFLDNSLDIERLKRNNPRLKLVVISEEPFWDTVHFRSICTRISKNVFLLSGGGWFYLFNHMNSELFSYETVPYFLTTDMNYIVRYRIMMENEMRKQEERQGLVGFFEKRTAKSFLHEEDGAKCLCVFRSELAGSLSDIAELNGLGHTPGAKPRQNLPDWHLDKLARCSGRFKMMFAIENTFCPDYATEKIFDAYACGCIPIYYGPKNHSVVTKLGLKSFVDVSEESTAENRVREALRDTPRKNILEDLARILNTVTVPDNFWREVKTRTDKIVNILQGVMESPDVPTVSSLNILKPSSHGAESPPQRPQESSCEQNLGSLALRSSN